MLLQTPLGQSRLLARPGDRRLSLLDAPAAALWDLHAGGLAAESLAELIGAHFALSLATAREEVRQLLASWQEAGLLDARPPPPALLLDQPDDPVIPRPRAAPQPEAGIPLVVADRRLALLCDHPGLKTRLARLLPGTEVQRPWVDHQLHLQGGPAAWRLTLDGDDLEGGQGLDAALVALLAALTELGCRPAERLIVLHGAGLVAPDGTGLLLIAPGGSGKTTLAAALDAAGYGLLSDDVVPVGLVGELWGLGLPLCLKPGSWPVLASRRPALAGQPATARAGGAVRYLPALSPRPAVAPRTGALFLSRYRPGQPPSCVPSGPEAALRGIIEAEAVLRALTQAKLDAFARWLGGTPAYHLEYPDLDQALALIDAVRARPAASSPDARP